MRTLTIDLTKDTGPGGVVFPGTACGWRVLEIRGTFGHPVYAKPFETAGLVRLRMGDVYRGPISSPTFVCQNGGTTQGILLLQVFDAEEWDAGSFLEPPAPFHEGRRGTFWHQMLSLEGLAVQAPGPGAGQQNVYCTAIRRIVAYAQPGVALEFFWGTGSVQAYPGNVTPVALESPAPPLYTAGNHVGGLAPVNVMGSAVAVANETVVRDVDIPLWTIPGFGAALSFILAPTSAGGWVGAIEFEEFGAN